MTLVPLLLACFSASSGYTCGKGTHAEGTVCVPDEDGVDTDVPDGTADGGAAGDDGADGLDGVDGSGADGADGSGTDGGGDTGEPPGENRRLVAYFTEWAVYDRDYQVEDIPAEQITHLNYAFVQIVDGRCAVYDPWAALEREGGNFSKIQSLKAAHPHLRVMISVGGWTLSEPFFEVASTPESRATFASSCVDFIEEHGFGGIDIDWEYPVSGGLTSGSADDTENYTLLLLELRNRLDAASAGYELSIAGPGGYDKIANLQPAEIAEIVDFINIMSYDFHGGWESTTGFASALYPPEGSPDGPGDPYTVDYAVRTWIEAGVPPEKLNLGLPLYGRGWAGVSSTDEGRFQSSGWLPWGSYESGVYDYSDIVENYVTNPNYDRHWDSSAMVPWLYSEADGVFITYEDAASVGVKLNYIQDMGLGGAMVWELSGDTDDHDLVNMISAEMLPLGVD
jgi:chitinase